ncbi:MAG: ATP-binding protein [Verrucomicrobia bacterium]|nr:ATP-binding protein [Verrucomicrobiota bacterium]
MDKETLKYVLAQAATRPLPPTAPRALELPLDSRKVVALVGIRRSGKTYLLYATMRRLERQGVDRRRLLYLNFEDDRLLPIHAGELDLILRAHEELYPEVAGQRKYVFFDEVQNVPSWETYVRRLHDTEDVRLFVTGSSSSLLARELASGLRGRSIAYEVFPLAFAEFLAFRGLKHEPYSRASEGRMAAALLDYLQTGGLPEIVLADEALRPRILKEYVDLVFYKDLVERYGVANPQVLRRLLRHCLAHPGSLFNVHKLYQDFRSQGLGLSKDTLYNYLAYLEESFVVFPLPVAERSLRKQAVNPKKLHPVDWALAYPFVAEPSLDAGRKLETAVFLHWRRQREDLAYLTGDHEVDLVVRPDRPEQLVNVAFSVTRAETWTREIAGLEWGAAKFPRAPRALVAHELGARKPPTGIRVLAAWQYLLAPPSP